MIKAIRAKPDHKARQSLRLAAEIAQAVDAARMRRAGNVSRNTWITEAILEKLRASRTTARPNRKRGAAMLDFFEFFAGGGMARAGLVPIGHAFSPTTSTSRKAKPTTLNWGAGV